MTFLKVSSVDLALMKPDNFTDHLKYFTCVTVTTFLFYFLLTDNKANWSGADIIGLIWSQFIFENLNNCAKF